VNEGVNDSEFTLRDGLTPPAWVGAKGFDYYTLKLTGAAGLNSLAVEVIVNTVASELSCMLFCYTGGAIAAGAMAAAMGGIGFHALF